MLTNRQLFLQYNAQTSDAPLLLDIVQAEGIYMTSREGKKYMDLISGISVSSIGHRHPKVIDAIKEQLDQYLYLMVYGEFVQSPQVMFAKALADYLPLGLDCTYFVNSGSEAVEGAMKLAKRHTGRKEIIACKNSYHGSTQGALSLMGNEEFKKGYGPLLPDITFIEFNKEEDLQTISTNTAAVFIEPIQGEAGIIIPSQNYLSLLRKRCHETGTLLVFDEIQTGFGRTGKLWASEHFAVVPDILLLAKAMGGGMPIGAFIASQELMRDISHDPILGHITTFGGHPVNCAAGLAAFHVLLDEKLSEQVHEKENLFLKRLQHSAIKEIRSFGLMIALQFDSFETNKAIIDECISNGLLTDWFLHNASAMRIAPPLIISHEEIEKACDIILKSIDTVLSS